MTVLLNPGPVKLSPGVRRALAGPDLCHREPEFAGLQDRLRRKLLAVYSLDPDAWAAVLLAGSGTAAVEAMVASLGPREGRLLILENGVYGERITRMAAVYGLDHRVLHHEWGAALDLEAVERTLAADPAIVQVAVVHHETTTGRLNDLAALGVLCRARRVGLLVDGVSSFGAEALEPLAWGLDACAATANKCLHGAPGLSLVVLRRDALGAAAAPPRSVYLDLAGYCRAQDRRDTPFTQPVHLYHALDRALDEFLAQGGWPARRQCYRRLAGRVREGLAALGVEPLLTDAETSAVLRAYRLPPGLDYATLHDGLKQRGFVIYAGQGALARSVFRISTMGDLGMEDMDRLLDACAELIAPASTPPP